jgi:hypothetical protein
MSMLLWDVTPCGLVDIPTFRRHILPPASAPRMEAVYSFETLVSTYKSTQCHNPEDRHRHWFDDLVSFLGLTFWNWWNYFTLRSSVCVCVCVCVRARECACVRVRVCVCGGDWYLMRDVETLWMWSDYRPTVLHIRFESCAGPGIWHPFLLICDPIIKM